MRYWPSASFHHNEAVQLNPAFSCVKTWDICVTRESKKGNLNLCLVELVWNTVCELLKCIWCKPWWFTFSNSNLLFCWLCMCVCVFLFYFLLVASESPHPAQSAVGARGWQRECVWILWKGGSDLRFPVWGRPGALVLLWGGGGGGVLDFLHECFVGKCLKPDLRSQGPRWEVMWGTLPLTIQPACLTHFPTLLFAHFSLHCYGPKRT